LAERILAETGVRGGLIVHLGCGDGKLTAALYAGESFVVHGLDGNADQIAKARARLHSLGVYGPVSVDRIDGKQLPYADNLVNLIVAENGHDVPADEVMRVLTPGGVAFVRHDGQWTKTKKPRPREIDEWTHFLHDASNNAVARDRRVGPPRRMQWNVGPLWSRSHEHTSSIAAMISGGGRLFYVVDEGLTSITNNTDQRIPDRWMLLARDAFNGVLLWKRPLPQWRGDEWKGFALRGRPASVPKRIVTDGERLFATLSHRSGVSILDPATGNLRTTIQETEGAQEVVLHGGTLIVYVDKLQKRRGQPNGAILAVDVDGNRPRWRAPVIRFLSQSLAADRQRVVCCDGDEMLCLSMADGSELWRASGSGGRGEKTIILVDEIVLEAGGPKIVARDAATGKTLWTAPGGQGAMRPMDLFVAGGCAWHASADGIAGYDLATGRLARTLNPSTVQSAGHHLRCYRAKATERFLITQFRGAEFVSLTDENHSNNDWIRGACRHGVMPANGLLYVPPNPCFCYPGAKLTGLLALAPDGKAEGKEQAIEAAPQLERGPAYGEELSPVSSIRLPPSDDWPTYRHDARRSGATGSEVPARVWQQWQVPLRGPITPPVVSGGQVFVAAKDEHTLYVFGVADGRRLWRFIAGGRIDSPPTVYRGLVLFGCADGRVYCLRASDGELVWRYRPVRDDRRIMAFNQLESAWRVHGSVLVAGGVAYCTAGRSSFLDGGIRLVGLDPSTGRVQCETRLDTWSPVREDFQGKPFVPSYHVEGSHTDVLVAEEEHVYLTQYEFDRNLVPQKASYLMPDSNNPVSTLDITQAEYTMSDPDMEQGFAHFRGFHRYMEKAHPQLTKEYTEKYGGLSMGDRQTGTHLATTGGFLDDTWFNRTFWMYSNLWPGWYHAHRGAKSGQLLVVGPQRTYALQAYPTRNRQSPLFKPDDKGYLLVVDSNDTEPVLDELTRGATKGMGYTRLKPPVWFDWVPVRIRGMVLAGKSLFVAGPPDAIDAADPMASFEGRMGAVLRAYSAADGTMLAEQKLDAPPVFDGLIAAEGRLFLSTTDGRLICMGPRENK
jgi:outer membrane protein assembly factor BamB